MMFLSNLLGVYVDNSLKIKIFMILTLVVVGKGSTH